MTLIIRPELKPESRYSSISSGIIGSGCTPRSATSRQKSTKNSCFSPRQRRPVSGSWGDVQRSPVLRTQLDASDIHDVNDPPTRRDSGERKSNEDRRGLPPVTQER